MGSPSLFLLFPDICRQNPDCLKELLRCVDVAIETKSINKTELLHLAMIFIDAGYREASIHFMAKLLKHETDWNVLGQIVWQLLMGCRTGEMDSWLTYCFQQAPVTSVLGIDVQRFAHEMKTGNESRNAKPRVLVPLNFALGPPHDLKPRDVSIVQIMLLASVNSFLTNALNNFIDTRNHLAPFVGFFLAHEAFAEPIHLFLLACAAHDRVGPLKSDEPVICAIGDEYAMLMSHLETQRFGQIAATPVPGLTIGALVTAANSITKSTFWNQLRALRKCRHLILCIGTCDIRATFPEWLARGSHMSVRDALKEVAFRFVPVLSRIFELLPDVNLYVHALFVKDEIDRPFVEILNESLKGILPRNIEFLDVSASIPAMLGMVPGEDAKAHGETYATAVQACFAAE
jgi:hypothetical protein